MASVTHPWYRVIGIRSPACPSNDTCRATSFPSGEKDSSLPVTAVTPGIFSFCNVVARPRAAC